VALPPDDDSTSPANDMGETAHRGGLRRRGMHHARQVLEAVLKVLPGNTKPLSRQAGVD
jgi:hypothetical protein